MRIRSVGAVLAAAALTLAYGADDDGESAAGASAAPAAAASPAPVDDVHPPAIPVMERRVDVEMKDIAFSPTTLDVKLGETVSFVFTNTGELIHDAFIGDKAAQDHHEKEMREAKDAHHHDGHEGAVTVAPGQTGTIRHRFDRPGKFEIGCHQPRHYEAGMTIILNVNVI